MRSWIAAAVLAASPALAAERVAVLAVHEPPAPDGELSELNHQLRAACTERVPGVLSAPEIRARLAGKTGGATLAELDRAFAGALAVYQNGEFDSAARTLRAIVDDLEDLPEGEAVWAQWTRAMMRLSYVLLTLRQQEESDAVQVALLKVDSTHQLDPVLYSPGFRAHFEELRQRVRAMPKRRLTVTARGRGGTIYVSGRDVGPTPATVILPAGAYRVAGAAAGLRIPGFAVDLTGEDRSVILDFALAEAVRPGAGPGLSLAPADRAAAIIRAGAWLGADRLIVTSRAAEGEAQFLVGSAYDVRRGSLLREGSVRLLSGGVSTVHMGALAAFLLTGQPSRDVQERTREAQPARPPAARAAAAAPAAAAASPAVMAGAPAAPALSAAATSPSQPAAASRAASAPPGTAATPATVAAPPAASAGRSPNPTAPPPAPDLRATPPPLDPLAEAARAAAAEGEKPPRWMRPTAVGAGVAAALLGAMALQQGLAASGAYGDADAMVLPGGSWAPGADAAAHAALLDEGDAHRRNAWIAAGGAVLSATASGVLWWLSREPAPAR
jgi:hypothetical protein